MCMFRAGFHVRRIPDAVRALSIPIDRVWDIDSPPSRLSGRTVESNAEFQANVSVEDDVNLQIGDAVDFLERYADDLRSLQRIGEFQSAMLDFIVFLYADQAAVRTRIPEQLAYAAVAAGVELAVSVYLTCDDDDEEDLE